MFKIIIPRVYTLGGSPLVGLVTHALFGLPKHPQNPQIISLLRSEKQLRQFLNASSTITLKQYLHQGNGKFQMSTEQVMSACRPPEFSNGTPEIIQDLILSINHQFDITQVQKYKKCLTPESNILFLNGDRNSTKLLFEKLWKNPADRPNMYQVMSDFRVWSENQFETSVLLGVGSFKIAKIPRNSDDFSAYNYDLEGNIKNEANIIKYINESRSLQPTFIKYGDFALLQAEHMIIKSTVGSLTTLFDCKNGELLHMKNISNLLIKHIDECISIIWKTDPSLTQIPYASVALNRSRILDVIIAFLKHTSQESTVMRREFNHWSNIEVQQTLGYFANLAIENNISGTHNVTLHQMLNAKLALKQHRDYNEDSYSNESGINLYI